MGKRKGGSRFPDAPGQSKKSKPNGPPAKPQKNAKPAAAASRKPGEKPKTQHKQYHANQEPVIPFGPHENILLVGEGDLSFAASLATHHGCTSLTATVLEKNEADLLEKYPHVKENITRLLDPASAKDMDVAEQVLQQQDALRQQPEDENDDDDDSEAENAGHDGDDDDEPENDSDIDEEDLSDTEGKNTLPPPPCRNRLLYNTDATTLKAFTTKPQRPAETQDPHPNSKGRNKNNKNSSSSKSPRKRNRPGPNDRQGIFTRIIFNFPHVGGKSTDVNRQVRHNQSLLVSFFERALPSLAPDGTIVVTLFEGEPYTLWNVRDLARHAGLGVERSFRFPWASYPGYRHARTLGVVKSKADREGGDADEDEAGGDENDDEEGRRKGESKTAWKGEERAARSYVFKRKDEVKIPGQGSKQQKKKRNGAGSESDSD